MPHASCRAWIWGPPRLPKSWSGLSLLYIDGSRLFTVEWRQIWAYNSFYWQFSTLSRGFSPENSSGSLNYWICKTLLTPIPPSYMVVPESNIANTHNSKKPMSPNFENTIARPDNTALSIQRGRSPSRVSTKSSCRLTSTALIIDQLSRDNIPTHSVETIEVLGKELPECYHICPWWSKSRVNDALRKSGTNVIFITIIPRCDIPMSHTCLLRCKATCWNKPILHLQLHSKLISSGTSNWQKNSII